MVAAAPADEKPRARSGSERRLDALARKRQVA
jgi:hypothetical protein